MEIENYSSSHQGENFTEQEIEIKSKKYESLSQAVSESRQEFVDILKAADTRTLLERLQNKAPGIL